MDIVDSRYDALSDLEWLATLPISRLDEIAKDGRCYLYGATTYYHPGEQMMFIVDDLCEAPATLGNVAYVRTNGLTYVCGKERWTLINHNHSSLSDKLHTYPLKQIK